MFKNRKLKNIRTLEVVPKNNIPHITNVIYGIYNKKSKKIYIGSTGPFYKRIRRHIRELRDGIHHNLHLQRSWNRYGENYFELLVIERLDSESFCLDRFPREIYWIEYFNSSDRRRGFNFSCLVPSKDPRIINRIRATKKKNKKPFPEQAKKKLSEFFKNCPKRKAWIQELARRRKSRPPTPGEQRVIARLLERTEKIKKAIGQFTLEGVLVAQYPSLTEADRATGFDYRNLSATCLGKQKTAYGFKWKYL
jgi:group I intron endonuclease